MGRTRVLMTLIDKPDGNASIINLAGGPIKAPLLMGPIGQTDSACGKCKQILIRGQSPETYGSYVKGTVQLVIKCFKCGAHNRVPSDSSPS